MGGKNLWEVAKKIHTCEEEWLESFSSTCLNGLGLLPVFGNGGALLALFRSRLRSLPLSL
jgi:hypothetical protein